MSPDPARDAPPSVGSVLDRIRGRLLRRSGWAVALGVAGVGGVVLLLSWLLVDVQGWASGTLVPLVLVAGGVVAAGGLATWIVHRFRSWGSEERLVREIEESAHLPRGSVRAQVELSRMLPPGVSRSLSDQGEGAMATRLARVTRDLAGRAGAEADRHFRAAGLAALVTLAVVTALGWANPDRARTAWGGLLHAGSLAVPTPLPPLALHPGDARLPRGVAPEVRVEATGRDSVTVHWRAVGEVPRSRTGEVSDEVGRVLLPPLTSRITYWATTPDGARTGEHELVPREATLLTDLVVEVHFPAHVRRPPETHRGWASPLVIPEGAELRIRGGVTGEGSAVVLREGGTEEDGTEADRSGVEGPEARVPPADGGPTDRARGPTDGEGGAGPELARFPIEEGTFSGSWTPRRSVTGHWDVEGDGDGEEAVPSPPLEVELVPDAPPRISLPVPGEDVDLPLSLRMPLLVEAEDDHGVAWVEIEAVRWRDGGEGERANPDGLDAPVVDRIPGGDRTRVVIRPVLDVSEWGLEPGDEVHLRARAGDNSHRTQTAETAVYRLRVPAAPRIREMARERIRGAVDRTEELVRSAARTGRELEELGRSTRAAGTGDEAGDFERREEIRELLEAREEQARKLEELRDELEEAGRSLPEGEPADDLLRERLRELARLLDQALGSQDRDRIREMLERIQEGGAPPSQATVGEMAGEQEGLKDRLEEALERLRRSALEAAFEGMEHELRDLTEAQEQLAARMSGTEDAAEQDALADRRGELEDRLEAISRELERDGAESVREALSGAAEDLSRAGGSMERAGDAARSGEGDRAREQGEQAAREAREALEQMEEARQEWMDGAGEEMREALRRTAQDALGLARRQNDLRDRMRRADPSVRRELEGEMAALSRGVRNLEERAALAARHVPDLGRALSIAIGEARSAVEETMAGLGGGGSPRPAPLPAAERAVEAMNRVALFALAGLDASGAGMEGSSMDQLLEELEGLAASQGDLNQEAASLSDEEGEPGAGERLEDLAAGQQGVAEGLEELAGRPSAVEGLGDLGDLAREAREIARELEEGRLDPETRARQERVLDRLLSAGRTLEREGETDEREGTPAGPVERRVVDPLSSELLRERAFPLPSAEELEALSPGERRLVLEYFERMNRRRAGGGER